MWALSFSSRIPPLAWFCGKLRIFFTFLKSCKKTTKTIRQVTYVPAKAKIFATWLLQKKFAHLCSRPVIFKPVCSWKSLVNVVILNIQARQDPGYFYQNPTILLCTFVEKLCSTPSLRQFTEHLPGFRDT